MSVGKGQCYQWEHRTQKKSRKAGIIKPELALGLELLIAHVIPDPVQTA